MKKSGILFLLIALFDSCIDRIQITVPDSYSSQLVVDGLITDRPGPYTVRLTKSTRIEKFLEFSQESLPGATVTIFDNMGNLEVLVEKEAGVYQTKVNGIQGIVGRTYSIKIETKDGKVYESIPDIMNPVGEVDSIYYEFKSYLPLNDQTRYGFMFYIDAHGIPNIDNLIRWKFTGVFEIDAQPQLHTKPCSAGPCCPDPRICSGFKLSQLDGETLVRVGECTCCTCWVTLEEESPHVSDNQFVSNKGIKKLEAGFIPLEYFPFQKGKYRAEIKQMSLSKQAFDYWQLIQAQKEGAASLFQPPTGKIRSNIFEKNGEGAVLGIFYASAVKTKQLYLTYSDIKVKFSSTPLWACEKGIIAESCILAFPNSSNVPPADWK